MFECLIVYGIIILIVIFTCIIYVIIQTDGEKQRYNDYVSNLSKISICDKNIPISYTLLQFLDDETRVMVCDGVNDKICDFKNKMISLKDKDNRIRGIYKILAENYSIEDNTISRIITVKKVS